MSLRLNDTYSTGFHINLTRSDGKTGYTLSPDLNFALTNTVGAYVEAGFNHIDQSPNSAVAGGGLAWMVTPTIQLDFSMDFGLNHNSLILWAVLVFHSLLNKLMLKHYATHLNMLLFCHLQKLENINVQISYCCTV